MMVIKCRNSAKALKTKKMHVFLELCKETEGIEEICVMQEREEDNQTEFSSEASLVIGGYPGLWGSLFLLTHYSQEMERQFSGLFLQNAKEWKLMADENVRRVSCFMKDNKDALIYPLGDGGMYKAIYQLGKDSNLGFHIHYQAVPVRQECIEICEYYDVDPWAMFSPGCILAVTENPGKICRQLQEAGLISARIGYMTKDRDKVICYRDMQSRINRPEADGLLRILQKNLEESL